MPDPSKINQGGYLPGNGLGRYTIHPDECIVRWVEQADGSRSLCCVRASHDHG